MAFMNWTVVMETGHAQIDAEHKTLVDAINSLHAAMKQGKGRDEISRTLKFLHSYTANHFRMEERQMAATKYPDTKFHMGCHARLITEVAEISAKHESGKALMTIDVMDFLERWLKDHIISEDKKLASWLKR